MGAAKPPAPSKQQKQAEALQLQLLQKQLKASEEPMEMPAFPTYKPPKPPPPPAVQTSQDVVMAEDDARRKAARRTNAGRNTIFAGETGGTRTTGQPSTLLG